MKESNSARRKLILAGLGTLAVHLDPSDASAQDPTKMMPRAYRVAFENDKLRVLDFTGRPGIGICGEGMHSHPAHLTGRSDRLAGPREHAGRTRAQSLEKAGDVFWSEAETHKVENTGKNSSRVLIIELKTPAKA